MRRFVLGTVGLILSFAAPLRAQAPTINDIKGKIFDAKMTQKMFAGGLRFCGDLNGNNFYLEPRNRLINLEDYHRSLMHMAEEGIFNPETKKPWNAEDANTRWERAKKQAATDQASCAVAASLPDLEKQLDDLQKQQSAASQTKN
jgi:hypothetical protein